MKKMNDTLKLFMSALESEVGAYHSLYEILKKEKDALIKWDIDSATLILFKKDEIVEDITHLEKRRMECAGDLGKKLFPERNESEIPTLKEIITCLDDKTALELNDYRDTQIELITKVRTLNSRNSLLMKRTVELISGSIDSMTNDASNNTSGYDKNGNFVKNSTPAKLIDGTV